MNLISNYTKFQGTLEPAIKPSFVAPKSKQKPKKGSSVMDFSIVAIILLVGILIGIVLALSMTHPPTHRY